MLGPGTGLGQVQLMWDTGVQGYTAWASEGSHAGFAPRGALQRELLQFSERELEMPVELEHVACGTGLKRIHRFLSTKAGVPLENPVRARTCCALVQIGWLTTECGVIQTWSRARLHQGQFMSEACGRCVKRAGADAWRRCSPSR